MKQMPMFLMMLLATALSDNSGSGGVASADKSKGGRANLANKPGGAAVGAMEAADISALRERKNAA